MRFHAEVRSGYEKLAEVLKCRVVLPESGDILYDGLMRDMPESLNVDLQTDSEVTNEVYYEITAYLETSVGNEYMSRISRGGLRRPTISDRLILLTA